MKPESSPMRGSETARAAEFGDAGFIGPTRVFASENCAEIVAGLRAIPSDPDPIWFKSKAVTSRSYYELAARRTIIDIVEEFLGPNVMLWGATLVLRPPGRAHAWHTDIETSPVGVRSVSVWIGLAHTNARSSLRLVRGSHLFGTTIQQISSERGVDRSELTNEDVERWAEECDPQSRIIQSDMSNGEALFFDGRLWHGSLNTNPEGERAALLLQYATPDSSIRIPDLSALEWPFRFLESPRPPCISMRGTYDPAINRFSAAPMAEGVPTLSSRIHELELPLAENLETGWKAYPIFRGSTPTLVDLGSHVSVLSPGRTPHPPHAHAEEEVLIMLSGEADLVIGQAMDPALQTHRLQAGSFVYYPAHRTHTIQNSSSEPCTYLMFKWRGRDAKTRQPLPLTIQESKTAPPESTGRTDGFKPRVLFSGGTTYLSKLQAHRTTLAPGAGYEPHVDRYAVVIVVLHGVVETLGRRVPVNSVIFYAAGEPHGMHNPGDSPASYLVFEFHTGAAATRRTLDAPRAKARTVRTWLRRRLNRLRQ